MKEMKSLELIQSKTDDFEENDQADQIIKK